jgi:vacuolar-type H+-ATPase subunit H
LVDIDDKVHESFADDIAEIDVQRQAITAAFAETYHPTHEAYRETVRPVHDVYREATWRAEAACEAAIREAQRIRDEAIEPARRARDGALEAAQRIRDEALEAARVRIMEIEERLVAEAEALFSNMKVDLAAGICALDFEWPKSEGDEDENALYISGRDYIDQVDRFRAHQGKDDEDAKLAADRIVTKACVICGAAFDSANRKKVYCGNACAKKALRRRAAQSQAEKDNVAHGERQ